MQNPNQLEALELDEFRVFQVTPGEIEERAHIRFPTAFHKGDHLPVPQPVADRKPLRDLADIHWD